MTRETEMHFANIPDITISRSKMVRPHQEWTSFNSSDLIPIYTDTDIMPGDTVKMKMSSVIRMMTPLVPVMDNCYADITFFFVPHRLVWDHWENFWGQNDTEPWANRVDYVPPTIKAPETTGWVEKSLADYFGYPLHAPEKVVSAFPIKAYIKIWNDFWRDQNWKNPAHLDTGDGTTIGMNPSDFDGEGLPDWDYASYGETAAKPFKVAKLHDYFTSVLPSTQKGPEVYLPLGSEAPVVTKNDPDMMPSGATFPINAEGAQIAVRVNSSSTNIIYSDDTSQSGLSAFTSGQAGALFADLSQAVGATITQLRQAYSIQRFYEALARGGSRYIETIRSIFGITNPDYRLQRAEYVGGFRMPINISQVVQSDAGASDATPLGHTGAMSMTIDQHEDLFTHTFTEHGTLMGLITVRHDMSYSQGCPRMYSRFKLFDYYTPQLANISEQPVLNQEIYCDGSATDSEAWGYQEAWAEYRYFPNQVHSELRSTYGQSLDVWTFQDYYTERPTMGDKWIDADEEAIKRTLAVQNHDQFFANFYFKPTYIRPMPLYSIPGLSGHF